MVLTPTTEDYLQAIAALQSEGQAVIGARLAERMKVSPASVSQTIDRMARSGLVRVGEGHRIELTAPGCEAADAIVRRHRITERFLTDLLHLGWVQVHEEAHRLEHAISDVVEARLSELLNHPHTCPHGAPIPGNFPAGADHDWVPLGALRESERATIVCVSEAIEEDRDLLEYCDTKNLRPGVEFRLTEAGPDDLLVLDVRGDAVALSGILTQHIFCRRSAVASLAG